MVSSAVMLDLPREQIWFVSRLLAERRQFGTRMGTRRHCRVRTDAACHSYSLPGTDMAQNPKVGNRLVAQS